MGEFDWKNYMFSSAYFWLSLSLICLIVEILTPGFLFAAFSLAALITGLSAFWLKNYYILFMVFALSSLLVYFGLKPWYFNFILKPLEKQTKFGMQALIGKTGLITKSIKQGEKGYIKIDGDEWQAYSKIEIEIGQKAQVIDLEGNSVWVNEI